MAVSDVDANGLRIRVATAGTPGGDPVLLLHGWPHTWQVWELVIPALRAAGHRVIAPDLRGLGGSERTNDG